MVKLSKTSKMPCKSWSLEARTTCPGSIDPATKAPYEVCKSCYAAKGFYLMPNSKASRDYNRQDWKRNEWVSEMVAAIGSAKYFRWFDSGDLQSVEMLDAIVQVCRMTPNVRHWLPTQERDILKAYTGEIPTNLTIRLSASKINGKAPNYANTSGVSQNKADVTCFARDNGNSCGSCRDCWDSNVQHVVYPLH